MIKLRLANEFLAGPIFCPELERMGHVEIDNLPLSRELKAEITAWDREYQATFNSDYPPASGFKSHEMELQHLAAGQQLARRMQRELGDSYLVEYYT